MLLKYTAALCMLLGFVCLSVAQTEEKKKDSPVKIILGKSDAEGNIVENPKEFFATDIPVFCYVDLVKPKPTLIMIRVTAKKVKGVRPNTPFATLRYRTKKDEIGASFDLKPKGKWKTGTYLIRVFLEGKEVDKREFAITTNKAKTS